MSFWQRLLRLLGVHGRGSRSNSDSPTRRLYGLDDRVFRAVHELAEREQRSENEVASTLLAFALEHRLAADENLERWWSLTPREQQVVALACKQYTNRQIAGLLVISTETVKTHIRNSVRKFGLRTKLELQQALEDWDFSGWDE